MLIQFSVSNFLSFNEKETFSMIAGKARKNIDRVFSNKKIKLTKCEVILGANASGKSNLVSAFQFAQSVIVDGLPRGFSKAPPHNSAARLPMSFPPSAACKFLDLPPVNLRNLHLHLTKNPFVSRPPHLCGVTQINFLD